MRRQNVVALTVVLIIVIQIFIRPLMFFTGVDTPYPYSEFMRPDWGLIAVGLLMGAGWIIVFSLSHRFSYVSSAFEGLLPVVPNGFDLRILFFCILFTTVLGAVLTGLLVLQAGSINGFMYSVKVGKDFSGSYVIREISVIAAIFSLLGLIAFAKNQQAHGFRVLRSSLFWAFALFLVFNCGVNYFWGNRYNIALLMISSLFAWHFHIRRLNFFNLALMAFVALLLLQTLKMVRLGALAETLGREIVSTQSFWLNVSTSFHLNQFDAFILAFRDVGERFDYRYGKDFLNGLLSWIPRSLYPEKESFHIGGWFRRIYQPAVVNGWPITTIGSWYVNFGILGVLFGAAFSGFVASTFDKAYSNVSESTWQAVMCPVLGLFMFDGGVGTGFVQPIFLVFLPVCLLSILLRLFKSNPATLMAKQFGAIEGH